MPRILAVEDEAPVLNVMSRVLSRAGHEVVRAGGGSEALEQAQTGDFDVAIVDYEIPSPNGLEVLSRLREMQPGCVRILASGRLDLPVTMNAVNQGAVSQVLEKPYEWNGLVSAVSEGLANREKLGELFGKAKVDPRHQARLRDCIDDDLLRLAVQPIYCAKSLERVRAYEALLRSSHPVLVSPGHVLNAAEQCDMLEDIGEVVARLAAEWIEQIPADTRLFMNLHPQEMSDPDALRLRLAPLHAHAHRTVLEITERSRVMDMDKWSESVQMLGSLGFDLAVDDLGAGYSSLSILAEIKPRFVKVDMSIVRDCDTDVHKRRLLDLLCKFADASDAQLIAEGVETEGESATVRECGVHLVQGYLYGRPGFELVG